MLDNIHELTFISSIECNLKCSYCHFIQKELIEQHKENQKIIEIFKSGQYLKIFKNFINNYNVDLTKVYQISLWGREPTLTLHAFNTQIYDLLDWAFNVQSFFFSTNGVAYVNRIIEFINKINQYQYEHPNRKLITIIIQFSFDGFEYNQTQRGIDPNIIINNIKKLLTYLNSIVLSQNVLVKLCIHSVLTIDNIKHQLSLDKNYYWSQAELLMDELQNLNMNSSVILQKYTAFFTFPYNASISDSHTLLKYVQLCMNSINDKYYSTIVDYMSPFSLTLNAIKFIQYNYYNLNNKIINNFNNISDNKIIEFTSCNPCESRITLNYDGTLLYCQNTIYDLYPIKLKHIDLFNYNLSEYLSNHVRFQPNTITASKDNINNFINLFQNENNFIDSVLQSNIINLMYLLLQNNQIDSSYKDYNKLLRHALYLTQTGLCYHGKKTDTGSFYYSTIGHIRLYCNGLLDYLENLINLQLIK